MSRVGKAPVKVPSGVEVTLAGQDVSVKGTKGSQSWTVPSEIKVEQGEGELVFTPSRMNDPRIKALWGLSRAMTANMVQGVSEGFERRLKINGVGYRAAVQGSKLNLSVGYSHPVNMDIPQGLDVQVNDNTEVVISGSDKQVVGQFAAVVRGMRPPEPYKGKGIRYADERIIMKEGKKK